MQLGSRGWARQVARSLATLKGSVRHHLSQTSVRCAATLAKRVCFGTKNDQLLVDGLRTGEEVELPSLELLNAIEEIAVRKFPSAECRMKSSSLYATAFLLDAFAEHILRPVVHRTKAPDPIPPSLPLPPRRQGLFYPIIDPREAAARRRKLRQRAERRAELEARVRSLRRGVAAGVRVVPSSELAWT